MRGKIQISVHQAMIYQVSIVLGTALLFVPSITTKFARQDAWISVILALLGGDGQPLGRHQLGPALPP